MKRQKRDRTSRAFIKGYQAGLHGKSKSHCPSDTGELRHQWMNGWRQGRSDNWDGFTGVASIHCRPSVP